MKKRDKDDEQKVHSIASRKHYVILIIIIGSIIMLLLLRLVYLFGWSGETESLWQLRDASLEPCVSKVWCETKIPRHSYFRFSTVIRDRKRWRKAQNQAARGDPVLLKKILSHFPSPHNTFLDGDIHFRSTHGLIDYFFDGQHGFDFLYENNSHIPSTYSQREIPSVYHAERLKRAPIIMTGYHLFAKDEPSVPYFQGRRLKDLIIGRGQILDNYEKHRSRIHHPFILMSIFNENWGLFSTLFPNRTTDWGRCCNPREMTRFQKLLDDPKLLLFLVNQHYNFTHPKLLALPRGLPVHNINNRHLIWETMQRQSTELKESLIFTASSNWKYRPQIKECIRQKFRIEQQLRPDIQEQVDFVGYNENVVGRIQEADYYQRLAKARLSIALPGLGYDTFRLWESLTLGVVPVLEKGVGLDKTLWRLPALLVEDYDEITPELLRTAYVEALYRVDEFEFERLTQQWWWSLILRVSRSQSSKLLWEKFPPQSEDAKFARPAIPFTCSRWSICSLETKKTPKSSC